MFEVYKPSGGVGFATWLLLIIGIVITAVLAYIYQFLLELIPYIYLNALMTLGLGIAIGTISAFIITKGHCRSLVVGTLIGLVLATVCLGAKFYAQYYTARAAGLEFLESTNEFSDEERPLVIAGFKEGYTIQMHLEDRIDAGWALGRGNNNAQGMGGWLVYLVWLIEAGIIFYFAWTMSRGAAKQPYSEKMNLWADEAESVMMLPITNDEMVSKIQAATSVDELLEIPIPKTDESAKLAQYIVNSIPGQEMEDAYLTVKTIEFSVNKKGEQETEETMLVENAVLSSQQRAQLVENAEMLNEAMDEFRASVQEERLAERSAAQAEAQVDVEGDG